MENMLSACLIVKNEKPCIERCLKSVKNHVDEIIVVDTGSTDNTVKLAKKYADRVLNFKWINDFSAARNFSVKCAKHDWVFIIDADEQVTQWDGAAVSRFINANDPHMAGNVNVVSAFDKGVEERYVSDRLNRLFDRKYFRLDGIIHEQPVPVDGSAFERVDVGITLAHSGYKDDEFKRKNKSARNIELLKYALEQNGDNCYLLFQLGKSYSVEKDDITACEYFSKAIAAIDSFNRPYSCDLITSYGYSLIHTHDFKGAMVVEQYLRCFEENPDFNFLLAYVYMLNALFPKAVETFLKCTTQKGGQVEGVTSWLPYYNIGVIYECLGKRDDAIKYYKLCGDYKNAKSSIAALLAK